MRASTSEPTASTSDDLRTDRTPSRWRDGDDGDDGDGDGDGDECATHKSSAPRPERRVRTRRRPHASTSVVGVRSRRLVRRDTFKHGPSAPPHQSRTRQLTSWRHLATRTHRARIAHRRSRVRRTFVSHFAVVESPSSSHARRGARARLWSVFKHRRSRSGACEWVERARACRSR